MSVSTNQLFHFTDKDSLINILTNNFIPHYSLERLFSGKLELAIPMVSFCDIPLTQTAEHISEYGDYAIGLSKEWGIKNKLNPVFYYCDNSILNNSIEYSLNDIFIYANKNGGLQAHELYKVKTFLNYWYYSKPYEGSNWDKIEKEFKTNKRILYNEREWRYIPEESESAEVNFIFKKTFINDHKILNLNSKMKEKKLFFFQMT
jgi:Putative abortive phage resistance protein AbiGi, antitoxin